MKKKLNYHKKIQLRKFPTDTRWQGITIRFLNKHEIIIKVKDRTHQTTHLANFKRYILIRNTKMLLARGQGFEPRLAGPEPAVLPLDDPRKVILLNHI